MLAAKNNVISTLAVAIGTTDTSITLVDASRFPAKGVASIAGTADPYVNEIIYYSGKSGNTLTGVVRAFDDTAAEAHGAGVLIGLAIIAKHVTDLQPKHGTTAERGALALTLTVDDTGRRFYDTDLDELFSWVGSKWIRSVIATDQPIQYHVGPAATVLLRPYKPGDLWADSTSSYKLRICKVTTITNTLADWVSIGAQN